jgi:hypothetical protein|tara:strand:- start:317 stop:994 length:678 start_codon:yes stop_codon:yes gene_type:complete
MSKLHYNPGSANYDSRQGMGYAKSQKIPSLGTGLGSEYVMGSSETGIYSEPSSDEFLDDDPELFGFEEDELDAFVRKVNMYHMRPDTSRWPRADRGSVGSSSNRWDLAVYKEQTVPTPKRKSLPKARKGISPFSSKTLYPSGFNGPPLGTGGSGQAFRTTGPYKRTGTQYGTSRAPIDREDEHSEEEMSYSRIITMDRDELEMARRQVRILKLLNSLEEGSVDSW